MYLDHFIYFKLPTLPNNKVVKSCFVYASSQLNSTMSRSKLVAVMYIGTASLHPCVSNLYRKYSLCAKMVLFFCEKNNSGYLLYLSLICIFIKKLFHILLMLWVCNDCYYKV